MLSETKIAVNFLTLTPPQDSFCWRGLAQGLWNRTNKTETNLAIPVKGWERIMGYNNTVPKLTRPGKLGLKLVCVPPSYISGGAINWACSCRHPRCVSPAHLQVADPSCPCIYYTPVSFPRRGRWHVWWASIPSHCQIFTAMQFRSHFSAWHSAGSVLWNSSMGVINIHTHTIETSRYTDYTKLQSRNRCFFKLWYKAFLSTGISETPKTIKKL